MQERLRADHPELVRIEIEPVARTADAIPDAMAGNWVAVLPERDLLAKRVVVHFELRRDRVVRRVPVWLAVSAYRPLLTMQRALRPGDPVGEADVVMREMDVTALDGAVMDSVDGLTGMRARRYLPANAVVRRGDLEPSPPVVREQQVAVRVSAGLVQIEARGVAQQDGQTAPASSGSATGQCEVYLAKVSGAGVVEIVRR
ncbi:MAG: flagellar basal body P-ring formation chaperone FlgA [Chromatiales bacterium]|nr:flagellar basal body P-ring formation chaperone FlgA [Chromatiales bacterium]